MIKIAGILAGVSAVVRCFGTSAEMWTGLQADYELRMARYEKAQTIEREAEPLAA